ncbi:hypothetical protein D9601_17000 [Sphingomonas sp. MA1305]|jgi:hypothetical protein|uniref:Mom family adenine methylcarbamoylation protein n=1 Tax=Sphingomonas sp. MA1305 TaxID=2479204 RepID=UPI0018DF8939|nr:hypothetical protein [Sphingomonas sp. MA1305]MBI0477048.1 hypothetical protein [Sphingomonas sp. MA1305]
MITDRSQRWRERRSLFVDDTSVIDPRLYAVDLVEAEIARAFVARHHYLATYPAAHLAAGLFGPGPGGRASLAGIAVFGVPAVGAVVTAHTGFAEPERGCVLARLLCLPSVAGNGESFFVSRAFRLLRRERPSIEAVVSYSDPRFGHVGQVYAALSGAYRGISRPRTVWRVGATTVSERTLSKIRGGERGAGGGVDRLRALGMPPPLRGEDPARWLERLKRTGRLVRARQAGLFTYCFELTRTARSRGRTLPRLAYPRPDAAWRPAATAPSEPA